MARGFLKVLCTVLVLDSVDLYVQDNASQTITFTSNAPIHPSIGNTYTAVATSSASAGLPVTLSIDATSKGICSIAGSTVTFTAAGNCIIDANQAGGSDGGIP
jgi:hypothetical protein